MNGSLFLHKVAACHLRGHAEANLRSFPTRMLLQVTTAVGELGSATQTQIDLVPKASVEFFWLLVVNYFLTNGYGWLTNAY